MSARREARARDAADVITAGGGMPGCLAIGRCIQVWAVQPEAALPPVRLRPDAETFWLTHASSAMRRFSLTRAWWLDRMGVADREAWQTIPSGAPWSAYRQPIDQRRSDVLAQLDELRAEATHLYDLAAQSVPPYSDRTSA